MKGDKRSGRPRSFKREDALERAVALFLSNGYEASSLNDLLATMGIARQSLYDTFKSKRELFLEALGAYEAAAIRDYRALLDQPGSPLAKLETILRGWSERARQRPFTGCLVNGAAVDLGRADAQIAQGVRAHFEALTELLSDCLQQAIKAGELLPETDAVSLARLMVNHCQGLIVMAHAGMNDEVIEEITMGLLRLLPRT